MQSLKSYNFTLKRNQRDILYFLISIVAALTISSILLKSIVLLLALLGAVLLLYLYQKNNLSYFYLVLYGLMTCIPWGRTGLIVGRLGWGAPSGAIFGIRIEYTHILIIMFCFAVVIKLSLKEPKRLVNIPYIHYFIIFITVGIVSSFLGLSPREGISYFLKNISTPMLGGFLIAFWITNSEKAFITFTWGIMLLTSIISLYALYEFITQQNPMEMFVLKYIPISLLKTTETYDRIRTFTYQSSATLGNPILAGFVMMGGFILSAGYYIYYSLILKSRKSIIAGIFLTINFAGIFVTFSRSIFFATFIALSIFIFPYIKNIKRVILIFSSICLIAISLIYVNGVYHPHYDIFLRFDLEYILGSWSLKYRLSSYIATLNIIKDYPLFGTGFVNVFMDYHNISLPVLLASKTLDNTYLEILSYSGIVGFFFIIVLILKFGFEIIKSLKGLKSLKTYPILYALYCALGGMLIASLGFWSLAQLTSALTFWSFAGVLTSITLTDLKGRFERI